MSAIEVHGPYAWTETWQRHTLHYKWLIDWVGFDVPLNIIGHIGDGFLQVKWPNRQHQSTEGSSSPKDRLQFHQVHITVLQDYACMQ